MAINYNLSTRFRFRYIPSMCVCVLIYFSVGSTSSQKVSESWGGLLNVSFQNPNKLVPRSEQKKSKVDNVLHFCDGLLARKEKIVEEFQTQ